MRIAAIRVSGIALLFGLLVGCPTGVNDDGREDTGRDTSVGADVDAGEEEDAGRERPRVEHAVEYPCGEKSPGIVSCRDRIEEELAEHWSVTSENGSLSRASESVWGERAIRGAASGTDTLRFRYEAGEPVDASRGPDAALQVAIRTIHERPSTWRGDNPEVRFVDDEGRARTLAPGGVRGPWGDEIWKRVAVPVEPRDGWRRLEEESDDGFDAGAVAAVELEFRSWGDSFRVWLDGLSLTRGGRVCDVECPDDCGERGTCRPARLGCSCEQGATGPSCGECAEGWVEGDDGSCELAEETEATTWPNEVSRANSDPWLVEHASEVEVLEPRVLVLNFANGSDSDSVGELVDQIAEGFRRASTYRGVEGADSEPQLRYQIAKTVDLRNGEAGNPEAPADWSWDNSTLMPRRDHPITGERTFDYGALFGERFAEHYGFEPRREGESPPTLCELIDQGRIHEVWMVAAHEEADAVPNEVVEFKQRYTANDTPIAGSFEPCAGNGCFDRDVSPCSRSVRIGFINYKRGPGCFMHSIGHGIEWFGNRRVVPSFSRWFRKFAGFRLDREYGLPFADFYEVGCDEEPCVGYPSPDRVEVTHEGASYVGEPWDGRCGNVHFPPNGRKHYDYDAPNPARSSCRRFGTPGEQCGNPTYSEVTPSAWSSFDSVAPDCGGPFLVWWYQHMPGGGKRAYHEDGRPMTPIWPVMFW